jgi:hypothetical protein
MYVDVNAQCELDLRWVQCMSVGEWGYGVHARHQHTVNALHCTQLSKVSPLAPSQRRLSKSTIPGRRCISPLVPRPLPARPPPSPYHPPAPSALQPFHIQPAPMHVGVIPRPSAGYVTLQNPSSHSVWRGRRARLSNERPASYALRRRAVASRARERWMRLRGH